MTKIRKAGSIEKILHEDVIRRFCPDDIENATGKKFDTFYNASNPDHRQQLSLEDAISLDLKCIEIGDQPPFFRRYQTYMRGSASPLLNEISRNGYLACLMKELGDVADALRSEKPREELLKELYEVLDMVQNNINAVEGETDV